MEIESIIRRKNGTKVHIDGKEYFFFSEVPDGPHVATVDNDAHAQRLLSITEGYRIYRSKPSKVETPAPAVETVEPVAAPVDQNRDELIAAYVAKFGKKPHYRASNSMILQQLEG